MGIAMRILKQRGVTLIEVVAVAGIIMVLAAIMLPNMARVIGDMQLRSAADTIGGEMQLARMRAVRDNKFYTVTPAVVGGFNIVCIDLNWNGNCEVTEPAVQLPKNVQFVNGGGAPSTALITCGPVSPPAPSVCPSGVTGLSFNPEPATVLPSFNARGLPCVGNPAATVPTWPASACFSNDPNIAGSPPVGFVYTFQYTGTLGANYAAVVVTPAGRVTTWMYRGKDAGGNDAWSR